jgi:hypothetical protein
MPRQRDPNFDYEAAFEEAEFVLRAIAPAELDGIPVYIVDAARAADAGLVSGDVFGWWSPFLDLLVRDLVTTWQGRGVAFIINPDFFNLPPESPAAQHATEVLATVLHEAAHAIELAVPLFRSREMPDGPAAGLDFNRSMLNALAVRVETEPAAVFRHCNSHDPRRFGRIASHLVWRSAAIGKTISPARVWESGMWSFSQRAFLRALGDEPQRLQALTFEEILKLPAPPAYVELCQRYEAAVTAYLAQQSQTGETPMPKKDVTATLQERAQARKAAALAAYEELLARYVAGEGEDLDPDETERILAEAGKSIDDLLALRSRLQRRQIALATIAKAREAQKQLERIDEERKASNRELNQHEKEHRQRCAEWKREEDLLAVEMQAKALAEKTLGECAEPELVMELAELRKERLRRDNRRTELLEIRAQREENVRVSKRALGGWRDGEGRRLAEKTAAEMEADLAEIVRLEDENDAALQTISQRMSEIEKLMRAA